ncbi:hypothetical protein HXX76_002968 [Chlamydomonas incerta]|uniref:Uncharacterized protein n=1 Tax=Chlamydomonas incerta TaxID=51695 RepID=A0A835TF09_CHLIN|nr:hypothetical protein HXX76_002968 [Chlamydomonas incerta]|eukprot:KAG2442891.1 hypothetical protein HXX76_002968 [Chlamydomonas incerta]
MASSEWAAELLGHALFLGAPVAFCYAGSYISGLYSRMEQELVETFTKAQLGPWEASGRPGPVLEAEGTASCIEQAPAVSPAAPAMLQYHNATFSRQSASAMSVCTDCAADSDCDEDDLDFCLVTPQQAVGTLGSHAPHYTKIFLNGLPLMADATDPSATLSLDECARRIKLASDSNRSRNGASSCSRATSLPSSPCLTPIAGLEPELDVPAAAGQPAVLRRHHSHTQPLQRSRSRLVQRSQLDQQAQGQQPEGGQGEAGLAADPRRPSGNGSFYRSGACSSAGSFRSTTSSLHTVFSSSSVFSCPSQRSSIDVPQETAAAAAAARRGEQQQQSQGDTEGPRQLAAPQVSCPIPGGVTPIVTSPADTPFAALASAPLSCPGATSGAGACGSPFASAAHVAGDRRRSISECGGTALCFENDTEHRVRDTDGAAAVHHDVDDLCRCLDSPCLASSTRSACELERLPGASSCSSPASNGCGSPSRPKSACGDASRAGAQCVAARTCARIDQQQQAPKRRWMPSGACNVPVPPRPQQHGPAHRTIPTAHSLHRINLSCSVDNLPMAALRHSRSSPATALPPLPPKAPAARNGSEPVPARAPPRAPCTPASAAAAAAAAAPVGLSKAPALPLPPDASAACAGAEAAVPPALRYYLRQARAAGVSVHSNAAGASSVSSSLDSSSGAGCQPGCGRPAGYVKATAHEYTMRTAKVITCHISPFPSPRQQMRKARSPPQAK